ncbi:hypothetical protein PBI_GAIA_170 [Mycobacterium phage Gaia]|uniref:Uncharacterized protein n=1 Tax=Mycobacterium phage Gaia TaxID=1486472 RepID=A0A068F4T5_9CAUD|nr:hypothetical protein VC46_gp066 [Mycobacterium phage Gaia]AID58986.1 hypothetical protein PBI_GAIA_170 [Mycobacterium phage Gaia]AYR00095.1 hypothetical protein PBI_NEBKISS_166 [Mycobacterium phage Nebkiss]
MAEYVSLPACGLRRVRRGVGRLFRRGLVTTYLFPIRPGDNNEELRFSLRSLEANMPEGDVWTVGYKPKWLRGVTHIKGNLWDSSASNVFNNIRVACEHRRIPSHVIVMNDDFFAVDPIGTVPLYYRSTLTEHLALPRLVRERNQWWAQSLRTTRLILQGHGIADPLSYELHMPFPVNTGKMAEVLNMVSAVTPENPPQWRSLYGNLCGIGGEPNPRDAKCYAAGELRRPFHSTDDRSFKYFADALRTLFPTPSRFEA